MDNSSKNSNSNKHGEVIKLRDAKAYTTPLMLRAPFPYRQHNGRSLSVTAGAWQLTLDSKNGLPYGRYTRLILAYMTTQAYLRSLDSAIPEEDKRTIPLGDTFNQFLTNIGLTKRSTPSGKTIKLVREQLWRISTTQINVERRIKGRDTGVNFRFVARYDYQYSKNPDQQQLFQSHIRLTQDFYDEVAAKGVPFDLNILARLRKPVSMDFYLWATYEVFRQSPHGGVRKTWSELREMFGSEYSDNPNSIKKFRHNFRKAVEDVAELWNGFRYTLDENGLYLPPQRPSITPTNEHEQDLRNKIIESLKLSGEQEE